MTEAIVAGHLCLHIIPSFTGDQGADPAVFLIPGRLMGKISDDALGKVILDIVSRYGLDLTGSMTTVASFVEESGALAGLRRWEEMLVHVDAGRAQFPLNLERLGWKWDGDAAVWHGPQDRNSGGA